MITIKEGHHFRIEEEDGLTSILCKRCFTRDYNPFNVKHLWCAVCQKFLEDDIDEKIEE